MPRDSSIQQHYNTEMRLSRPGFAPTPGELGALPDSLAALRRREAKRKKRKMENDGKRKGGETMRERKSNLGGEKKVAFIFQNVFAPLRQCDARLDEN